MDKKIPAVLVVAALAAEAVLPKHSEALVQPHVEPELKICEPSTFTTISGNDGGISREPLGTFRWNTFYRKMLRANMAKNKFLAMLDAYVETAHAIREHYPDLKMWERWHQYNCFKHQIALTHGRTRKDYFNALVAIAHALEIS
jgi:hypothetical protein